MADFRPTQYRAGAGGAGGVGAGADRYTGPLGVGPLALHLRGAAPLPISKIGQTFSSIALFVSADPTAARFSVSPR